MEKKIKNKKNIKSFLEYELATQVRHLRSESQVSQKALQAWQVFVASFW